MNKFILSSLLSQTLLYGANVKAFSLPAPHLVTGQIQTLDNNLTEKSLGFQYGFKSGSSLYFNLSIIPIELDSTSTQVQEFDTLAIYNSDPIETWSYGFSLESSMLSSQILKRNVSMNLNFNQDIYSIGVTLELPTQEIFYTSSLIKPRELKYKNLILMGDLYLDYFNFGFSILSSTVSDSDFANIYPLLTNDQTYNRLSEISKSEFEYFIGYKWSSFRFQIAELHKIFALDLAQSLTRNYKLSTSLNTQLNLSIFSDGISSHGLSFSYQWF